MPRITAPGLPLSAYDDLSAFKIYAADVSLLRRQAQLAPTIFAEGNRLFREFKGALTEQYVCQQLVAEHGLTPYYWSAENSTGEIDFLTQDAGRIFAIEVKAEENLRAKSLRAFKQKHPEVSAVRFSLSGYREQDWMRNVPLYAIGNRRMWEG